MRSFRNQFLFTFALTFLVMVDGNAATRRETQNFLRENRHAWLPYPLPAETTTNELAKLLQFRFNIVGLCFAGPYNGGNIDFSHLERAIVISQKSGSKVLLHLFPRFLESEGIFDQLSDGSIHRHSWNRDASAIDIFDPSQRARFNNWLKICVRRYGHDSRIAGFAVGWGYMGETGFYIGNYLDDFSLIGTVNSGYSTNALQEFNRWRTGKKLPLLDKLPMPSSTVQTADYIQFHRFRSEFIGHVFQKEAIATVQSHTRKPVGIQGYIAASVMSYARDWTSTPNADFYRTAGAAASFDLGRSLIDSGVGWEDCELHDGKWNFTFACLRRDLVRQIARGGAHHAMPVRLYDAEPQWETNIFANVAHFLLTNHLTGQIRPIKPAIALYQPTWGAAALPAKNEKNPFLPREEHRGHLTKMIGLMESFGLPYELITESELLKPRRLRRFRHIILPMSDLLPSILGNDLAAKVIKDRRVIPLPLRDKPLMRSEFRKILAQHDIEPRLDFDSDYIHAGRIGNLIYNWTDNPVTVDIKEFPETLVRSADSLVRESRTQAKTRRQGCPRSEFPEILIKEKLAPYEYRFLPVPY